MLPATGISTVNHSRCKMVGWPEMSWKIPPIKLNHKAIKHWAKLLQGAVWQIPSIKGNSSAFKPLSQHYLRKLTSVTLSTLFGTLLVWKEAQNTWAIFDRCDCTSVKLITIRHFLSSAHIALSLLTDYIYSSACWLCLDHGGGGRVPGSSQQRKEQRLF